MPITAQTTGTHLHALALLVVTQDVPYGGKGAVHAKGTVLCITDQGVFMQREAYYMDYESAIDKSCWPVNVDGSLSLWRDYWSWFCNPKSSSEHGVYYTSLLDVPLLDIASGKVIDSLRASALHMGFITNPYL